MEEREIGFEFGWVQIFVGFLCVYILLSWRLDTVARLIRRKRFDLVSQVFKVSLCLS